MIKVGKNMKTVVLCMVNNDLMKKQKYVLGPEKFLKSKILHCMYCGLNIFFRLSAFFEI